MQALILGIPILSLLAGTASFIFMMRFNFIYYLKHYHHRGLIIFNILYIIILIPLTILALAQLVIAICYLSGVASTPDYQIAVTGRVTINSIFVLYVGGFFFLIAAFELSLVTNAPFSEVNDQYKFGKLTEPVFLRLLRSLIYFAIILLPVLFLARHFYSVKFIEWVDNDMVIRLVIQLIPGAIVLRSIKSLYKQQKDVGDFLNKDFKVLFLRSFYLDNMYFTNVEAPVKEYGNLMFAWEPIFYKPHRRLTFERYFGYQILNQIGEFVGIGSPDRRIPKEGISSLFPKTSEWETLVASFIVKASVIFIQIGITAFLAREMKMIIESANLHKLYIFTEPEDIKDDNKAQSFLKKWIFALPGGQPANKRLSRHELREYLETFNIQVNFDPPVGAVISFEGMNAILLKSECKLPSEYIKAVRERIYPAV